MKNKIKNAMTILLVTRGHQYTAGKGQDLPAGVCYNYNVMNVISPAVLNSVVLLHDGSYVVTRVSAKATIGSLRKLGGTDVVIDGSWAGL